VSLSDTQRVKVIKSTGYDRRSRPARDPKAPFEQFEENVPWLRRPRRRRPRRRAARRRLPRRSKALVAKPSPSAGHRPIASREGHDRFRPRRERCLNNRPDRSARSKDRPARARSPTNPVERETFTLPSGSEHCTGPFGRCSPCPAGAPNHAGPARAGPVSFLHTPHAHDPGPISPASRAHLASIRADHASRPLGARFRLRRLHRGSSRQTMPP